MKKGSIDLTDIKSKDVDDTATFTDLLSKSDKKKNNADDIEDMVNERKRNTKDLTKDMEKAKEEVKKEIENTKVFNISEEKPKESKKKKKENKKTPSAITDIGVFILIITSYFIYCLLYTNFYNSKNVLLINSITIIVTFVLYGFAIVLNKNISKIIVIVIFFIILVFITFNLINSLGIRII